ncbi:MAG: sensor histidine kinase, partial [Thermoanaerobaculia bacterium]
LLAIPTLPLSYLYAIYKHRLSALEFRANRLLGRFGFFALWVPLYALILVYLGHRSGGDEASFPFAMFLVSVALVAAAPALRARFRALVDRHVFGVKYTHEEVVELVSARIPAAFERTSLARAVRDEIMPTLLVRQSALYLFEGEGVAALYEQAVPAGEAPPGAPAVRGLLARAGIYLPAPPGASEERFAWVRLVLPVAVQGEVIGAWLLGRRDPDDHFPASDIHLLATVANQIASMVENIRLYEQAQQEIAQRKAAEEETRRSHLQLLHAQKMEAIGRLASGVAHDFNNCLLVILGYTDLLLSEHGDDAALGPRLNAIYEAGRKAATLTRDLLTFARRQPMEAGVVDLNDAVGSVEKMLRRLIGDDVRLETELHPRLGKVRIDPGRMEHILLNLAVNARHAMPHGGRLALR